MLNEREWELNHTHQEISNYLNLISSVDIHAQSNINTTLLNSF